MHLASSLFLHYLPFPSRLCGFATWRFKALVAPSERTPPDPRFSTPRSLAVNVVHRLAEREDYIAPANRPERKYTNCSRLCQ